MRNTNRCSKSGFTLVELMVVAIIVAILAAVAIPLMSGNKKRAMSTEAEAALGTIRTQLRVMYAETGTYATNQNGTALNTAGSIWQIPGVNQTDLDGKYWETNSYSFATAPTGVGTNYILQATFVTGCDPALSGVTITLNAAGVFTRSGL